ncbi:hypothetical protein D3C86_1980260 [compost metagenome]
MAQEGHDAGSERLDADSALAGQRIERHVLVDKPRQSVEVAVVQCVDEAAGDGLRVGHICLGCCFRVRPRFLD